MKKTLLTTFLTMLSCTIVYSAGVTIDYQDNNTHVHQASVERNLLINSSDDDVYNIAIKPLNSSLSNLNGDIEIPLENLYINNTREDVYLKYNEYSNLFEGIQMNGIPRNMIAKIRDFGMIPSGTYMTSFEVQATNVNTSEISTSTFYLQFVIPTVQTIDFHNEVTRIEIGAEDAFKRNQKVISKNMPMIYINSNCDWELSVNSDNFGENIGNYYIRTVGASSGVKERLLEKVLLTPGNEIIIAKGKAPANNENVSVEFSLESKDGKIFHTGRYENRIKYILREAR